MTPMTPRPRQQCSNQPQSGFTLTEVLVGMLLTFAFVGTSLQALVVSTTFRVKAQEVNEATTWIQEDLENIRFEAKYLDYYDLALSEYVESDGRLYQTAPLRCDATSPNAGYADLLRDRILVRLNDTLTDDHDIPDTNSQSGANASTVSVQKTSQVGARPYQLTRTLTPAEASPYNVLRVTYTVTALDGGPVAITTLYTEVIPHVSFYCA